MRQLMIRSCLFVCVVYAVSMVLSMLYTETFKRYKPNRSKSNWVLLKQGDHYDYAALGSSRILHMVDVSLLNRLTGKKGINLGVSGSSYADNYALLTKYLERNSIKKLLLNADEFSFHSSTSYTYPFKDYDYMPYFFEDSIRAIYRDNVPYWKYTLWTAAPLSRYIEFNEHYEWSALLWYYMKTPPPFCAYDTTAGSELLYDLSFKQFTPKDTANTVRDSLTIEQKDEMYFERIATLCQSKGIELILVTPPIFDKGIYAKVNRTRIREYIQRLAVKKGLRYIDYYDENFLQNIQYFRDMTHTNAEGSRLYTHYLSVQLKGAL